LHCGTGVLTMMENSPDDDFGSLGLVVVNDVLLHLEAATAREEVIPWLAGLRVLREYVQSLNDQSLICPLLLRAPRAPRVQQDVQHVPIGFTGKMNSEFTGRHQGLVPRHEGTVLQLSDRDLEPSQA
jgi:hypothetical protein